MWERRKSPYDYARYFAEWHERDLTDEILRDRNHASVFMWSIGNEVLEQWSHADATELDLQAANLILNAGHAIDPALLKDTTLSRQSLITRHLAAIVKRLDTSRVVTAGCNEVNPANHLFRSDALDVLGFNYHERYFEPFLRNFPGKKLIVSESTSALMTRAIMRCRLIIFISVRNRGTSLSRLPSMFAPLMIIAMYLGALRTRRLGIW